jgi:hypothetical protein
MTLRLLIAVCVLLLAAPFAAAGQRAVATAAAGQTEAEETASGETEKAATDESFTVKIEDMEFCTGIESWSPVGAGKMFPSTVGKVYCFTRVTGAAEPTEIVHVWYLNEEEKARVTLAVRSKYWRTWSSKLILEQWTGKWRVDVQAADGKLLRSSEFLVESKAEQE